MANIPLVTEAELQSATVEPSGELTFTRANGVKIVAGTVSGTTDAQVADFIGNGPLSKAQTSATNAAWSASKRPGSPAARTGVYLAPRKLYLPPAASLAGAKRIIREGLAGQHRKVAFIGHSIVAGQGGRPGVTDQAALFVRRAKEVGQASTGIVTTNNRTTRDERQTATAEWKAMGAARGNMQLHMECRVPDESWTYQSKEPGTIIDIFSFSNSAQLRWRIDGGSWSTFTPSGTNVAVRGRATGKPDTTHLVEIQATTTSPAFLMGVSVGSDTGLQVSNFGYSGSIAADWTPGAISGAFYNGNSCVDIWNPNLVIIQLGANEIIHSVGSASLATNLPLVIEEHKAKGREVVLIVDPPIYSTEKTTWLTDFYPAIYDVADAKDVPLIDYTAAWQDRSIAAAKGWMADQWHPNSVGYSDLHEVLASALLG